MRKYMKWITISLVIIIIAGILFFAKEQIIYKEQVKNPEVTKSMEQIEEENKLDLDKVKIDKSIIKSAEDIYDLIHQMANTLIVAEDNLIIGEIPINDQSINEAMFIVKDNKLISKEEKEVFLNVLNDWKHKDYSNGVQAHNYTWKLLKGNMGRAKELRPEFKK
ncbi:MAG: hypothetical protein H7Y18_16705 [Clostridiaceae bacterium]|nr:hypothetical protein [Clostridiaceae bacterium]